MSKSNNKYISRKFAITALLIYLLLLGNVSFHHHVFEINYPTQNEIKSDLSTDAVRSISVLNCPIVHFAQNSFQGLITEDSVVSRIENSTGFSIELSAPPPSPLNLYTNLRAPPSNA